MRLGKLVGLLLLPLALLDRAVDPGFPRVNATINGQKFDLFIADTPERQAYGFKNRDVGRREAMLFRFSREGVKTFWMKGTRTPLDIIFLDRNFTVTSVERNARPCRLICELYLGRGKYVLELRGGVADELAIEPGRKVRLDYYKK